MSKTKEQQLGATLELKPHHLDAIHLMDRFMMICRDTNQTPKKFESAGNDILSGGFDLGSFEPS